FSRGRFLFGIGAGWLKEETQIMGGDFDHRWTQTRESVLAMKELWTKPEAEFHGRHYDFPPVRSYPKPAQKPHPPVLLGGAARKDNDDEETADCRPACCGARAATRCGRLFHRDTEHSRQPDERRRPHPEREG